MEEIGAFINRFSVGVRLFGFYDPVGRCGGFSYFKGLLCRIGVGFGGSFLLGSGALEGKLLLFCPVRSAF